MTFKTTQAAVAGIAAAFRLITEHRPVGEPGDKVFPATYNGGEYAVGTRMIVGREMAECVLLDSVQSQANRMELALPEPYRAKRALFPLLVARFKDAKLLKKFTVTSLEEPHARQRVCRPAPPDPGSIQGM